MPDGRESAAAARILIAEDETFVAKDLALTIQDLGYQVAGTVPTGILAIQLAAESKPDLILMDIKLRGEIDGIQASEQIRARFDIPVIFLTAYDEADLISRAKVTQPYGFLTKPFSYHGLKTTIETALYRHAADKRMRESEERYRTLVEQSIDGIGLAQGTTVRFVNSSLARMFGFQSPEEMVGQNFLTFVAPEDRDPIEKRGRDREAGKSVTDYYEFKALRKDGTTFDAEVRDSLTTYRGDKVRQGIIRDVTERKQAEEARRESEERFRKVFEQGPIGMGLVGTEGRFLAANSRLCQMLGYTEDELTRLTFVDITHPEHLTKDREAVRRLYAGEIPYYKVEKRYVKKDGDILWGNLTAAVIRNSEGKLLYTLPMIEDITDRKQAEEALQIKDNAMNSSISGIAIGDFSGKVIYVNPAVLRLWGYYHESEMLGRPIREFWLMDEKAESAWKKAAKTGYWIGELVARKRDGSSVDLQVAVSLLRKPDGKPMAIMGSFMDITDRKRAERALRESEEKYRALFEESRDAVSMTTREGVVEEANQAFLDLYGFTREEATGMDILKIYVDHEDRKQFQQDIERNGSVKDYPVKRRRKDGTQIDCLLSSTVRKDKNGKIVGYQGIVRDVTEQKKLQRQLLQAQKMEAIGTLAGGIAHDFNNLLQVTMGYAEVLLSRKDNAHPEYAGLQHILQAGRSGAELAQKMFALSRKTESKQRPIDLNQQIEQVRGLLDRTIPKMIKIELRLADPVATVNADPTQIEQIIMNLVLNARDFMPEGGKLTVSTKNVTLDEDYCGLHPGAIPGKHVLLAVSDTGSGMDQEILDNIFEPFFTTKGVGKGTGLGLAVVYGIVKQHGGHVTCESRPGHGAVFNVYLPAIEEQGIVSEVLAKKPELPGGTETILLVDDESVVRDLGELILSEAGYNVLAAKNGKEALDIYRREQYSVALVILDLIMPEMGGKQCMEGLLKINPTVRVLVASGYASGGAANAIELGAKAFVNKPFNVAQLLQQVRTVLDLEI